MHRHITGGYTPPKPNQEIVLHSGECNWRFKFKLIGLERLNVIFNEIKQRVATDNLNTEPRNVTLKATKLSKKAKKDLPTQSSTVAAANIGQTGGNMAVGDSGSTTNLTEKDINTSVGGKAKSTSSKGNMFTKLFSRNKA